MKFKNTYIYGFLISIAVLCSCQQEEVPVYDQNGDGVYFLSISENDTYRINFGDQILGDSTSLSIRVNVKIMGRTYDHDRKVSFKIDTIEGHELADIVVPEIVFRKGEFTKDIKVRLNRPAEFNKEYAASITIREDDPDAIPGGIKSSEGRATDHIKIYVKEAYQRPQFWEPYELEKYFGQWNPEKHRMLIETTKNTNYAQNWDPASWAKWSVSIVEKIREKYKNNQEVSEDLLFPLAVDVYHPLPIYLKPYYWTAKQEKYLGQYKGEYFMILIKALKLNTQNEKEKLDGTEEELKETNKMAVKTMLTEYNRLFRRGTPGVTFKSRYWFPILSDIDYEYVKPESWANNMSKEMITRYYGEYSEEKYRFMIKTYLESAGATASLAEIFPVRLEWTETGQEARWDDSTGGENKIRSNNQLFREKANQEGNGITFPEV